MAVGHITKPSERTLGFGLERMSPLFPFSLAGSQKPDKTIVINDNNAIVRLSFELSLFLQILEANLLYILHISCMTGVDLVDPWLCTSNCGKQRRARCGPEVQPGAAWDREMAEG